MQKIEERKRILRKFTVLGDQAEIPITNTPLDFSLFNPDFYSQDRTFAEVEDIVENNRDKMIDVRPYMIETPFIAQSTDRLQKILDMFRHMHLKSMPVTNPSDGGLEGIITRQDIFAYMSL